MTDEDLNRAEKAAYVHIYAGAHNTDHAMSGLKPGATCPRCEATARTLASVLRPLFEAESLEIQAGIYQATPDRKTTYDQVGYQLSEHARLTRLDYDEARIRAAALRSNEKGNTE